MNYIYSLDLGAQPTFMNLYLSISLQLWVWLNNCDKFGDFTLFNLIEINSVSFCLLWYINFIIFDCKFHKSHQFHILQYSDPNIKYKAHKFVFSWKIYNLSRRCSQKNRNWNILLMNLGPLLILGPGWTHHVTYNHYGFVL